MISTLECGCMTHYPNTLKSEDACSLVSLARQALSRAGLMMSCIMYRLTPSFHQRDMEPGKAFCLPWFAVHLLASYLMQLGLNGVEGSFAAADHVFGAPESPLI